MCIGVCYLSLLAGIVIAVEPAGCCVNPNENIQRKSPLCLFWEMLYLLFHSFIRVYSEGMKETQIQR